MEELKYKSITHKWGGIEVRRDFDKKIDIWLSQFNSEEKKLLLSLLSNFQYYTDRMISNRAKILYDKLINIEKVDVNDFTVFIPVYKTNGVGYSDNFFYKFWFENDIYDYAEKDIYSLIQEDCSFNTIVIVDDFSGTGDTIKKTIDECIEMDNNIKTAFFCIITIHISQVAEDAINKYAEENNLNIKIVYYCKKDKIFKRNYIYDESNAIKFENLYLDMCKEYNVPKDYKLGYKESQAMVSFEYNTPNNTLGLFWAENKSINNLFKRHKKKRTDLTLMQDEAKKRKAKRNAKAVRGIENENDYIFLMVYFVELSKEFDFDETKEKFGMTNEQLDKALKYMIEEKYILIKNGRFEATDLLKKRIKTTNKMNSDSKQWGISLDSTSIAYIPKDFGKIFSGYDK